MLEIGWRLVILTPSTDGRRRNLDKLPQVNGMAGGKLETFGVIPLIANCSRPIVIYPETKGILNISLQNIGLCCEEARYLYTRVTELTTQYPNKSPLQAERHTLRFRRLGLYNYLRYPCSSCKTAPGLLLRPLQSLDTSLLVARCGTLCNQLQYPTARVLVVVWVALWGGSHC